MTGIILVILGILALIYQGFSYTETKQDAQIGSLTIQHDETKTIPIAPIVGGVLVAAGAITLFTGNRRNS
ncbi:MAG: hypothetical protein LV479_12175 [Methylacidiphilales bacterium]|nr:hypothetical protein [Candidatus Methylacidiphilales bacterium]